MADRNLGSCDHAHSIGQLLWTPKWNYFAFLCINQVSIVTPLALRTALKKTTAKTSQGSDEFYMNSLFSIFLTDGATRNFLYEDNHQKVYVVLTMRVQDTSVNRRDQINRLPTTPQCLTKVSELRYFQPTPWGELPTKVNETFSKEELIWGGSQLQVTYLHVQRKNIPHLHKG